MPSYLRSSRALRLPTLLSHAVSLLGSSVPQSAQAFRARLTASHNSMCKRHPASQPSLSHAHSVSPPIASSTSDAPRAALDARLSLSQLLPEEEHGGSPDCNTTCTQPTAKEACNLFAVIYSLQQREHQRIRLRWSPASLEGHACLSLALIFWGWV